MADSSLPYNVVATAANLFARDTGFTRGELTRFFCSECGEDPLDPPLIEGFSRAEYFENWLSSFPLGQQYDIIRRLCRLDLPMSKHPAPSVDACRKLMSMLESAPMQELTLVIAAADVTTAAVEELWQKALGRKANDPDGAITAARSLLESVCRHILDDLGVPHTPTMDLAELHSLTSGQLRLAPDLFQERVFKQILSGCRNVVTGLATLRNGLSDSHGRGRGAPQPAARHAALAVNLAGAMAVFLLDTHEARKAERALHGDSIAPVLGGEET